MMGLIQLIRSNIKKHYF